MPRPAQIEATAYHEAGHAVMAWHEGLPIERVTIASELETAGKVEYANALAGINLEYESGDQARSSAERMVRIALAGPIAQRRHRPNSLRSWHGHSDYFKAADLTGAICVLSRHAEALLRALVVETEDVLCAVLWPFVGRLARELLRARTMTGAQVVALLSERA